ncbi:MAG TPA: glycosyltransferase family 4 protein [Candidatus Saccharimonadales bacterium]|nr:glycosyltransferase family 4 protein [Candidatus Saccharimonadales bacterium]
MKILFLPAHYVFDDHQYGTEPDHAYNIVNRIASLHPDSLVVTGRKNILKATNYRIMELQPHKAGFNMSFQNALIFNIRYTVAMVRILRKEQFDLIHHVRPFELGSTFNMAILLGVHKRVPFVVGSFCSPYAKGKADPANYDKPQNRIKKLAGTALGQLISLGLGPLCTATLKKADAIFVVNRHTRELVLGRSPQSRIVIMPPGKDRDTYRYNAHKKYHRDKLTFISVGNLIPRKGFDQLIAAFGNVAANYPEARLLIVGGGFAADMLQDDARRHGVAKQVIFTGRMANSDMPALYAQADIYAAMPIEEAFGHTYIEAMASGLPIIATATIGATEIIGGEPFGKLITCGDTTAMAAHMGHFLRHPKTIPRLARLARAKFEKYYAWSGIIPRYLETYQAVLDKRITPDQLPIKAPLSVEGELPN